MIIGNIELGIEDTPSILLQKFYRAISDHYLELGYYYGFINLEDEGIERKYTELCAIIRGTIEGRDKDLE
jgi:hypothetical protein